MGWTTKQNVDPVTGYEVTTYVLTRGTSAAEVWYSASLGLWVVNTQTSTLCQRGTKAEAKAEAERRIGRAS